MNVKFVAYVMNPYLPGIDIVFLGVSERWDWAVTAVMTEADAAEHEDARDLAIEALDRDADKKNVLIPWMFDNADGVTYHVEPVHDIDNN